MNETSRPAPAFAGAGTGLAGAGLSRGHFSPWTWDAQQGGERVGGRLAGTNAPLTVVVDGSGGMDRHLAGVTDALAGFAESGSILVLHAGDETDVIKGGGAGSPPTV